MTLGGVVVTLHLGASIASGDSSGRVRSESSDVTRGAFRGFAAVCGLVVVGLKFEDTGRASVTWQRWYRWCRVLSSRRPA
mmetsp:Transcript_41083/g.86942  ORF Transcript_41083/g.86942 Transcript_41083/m.86942 type:complete len:80 (+) Transcript_41083:94-333(+)